MNLWRPFALFNRDGFTTDRERAVLVRLPELGNFPGDPDCML